MIAQTLEFAAALGEVHLLSFGEPPKKPAPDYIDALGIGGPALTLKSSGKLDLATMAQA
ncbi:hypothetical protein [Hyphomonas sp. NPDC076881]|uniref:hypothetical protein n=1 Tax=Hyphomonas sp. NPDC076881 TaxID=3390569 RepID=UPI003D066864